MRLQAEHEARTSSEALLLAAEEAGIERRFLMEAAAQVSTNGRAERPQGNRAIGHTDLAAWACFMLFCGALAFWGDGPLAVTFILVAGVVLGLSIGRRSLRAWTAPAGVLASWLVLTLFFALYSQMNAGNTGMIDGRFFLWIVAWQTVMALLGSVLAIAERTVVRSRRPQS